MLVGFLIGIAIMLYLVIGFLFAASTDIWEDNSRIEFAFNWIFWLPRIIFFLIFDR